MRHLKLTLAFFITVSCFVVYPAFADNEKSTKTAQSVVQTAISTTPKKPTKSTANKIRSTKLAQAKTTPTKESLDVDALREKAKQLSQRKLDKPRKKPQKRTWNLKDVELRTLIDEISEYTGKNFVIGPKVEAKVTFISQEELSPEELYKAFEALLRAYGFNAIPEGKVVKIVPISVSKKSTTGILLKDTDEGAQIVVTTYRVKNYPVNDLVKIIKPLLPRYSYIEAYKPSNDLIIADVKEGIPNIIDLIERLDKPVTQHLEVIHLKHAMADELAKSLNDLLNPQQRAKATAEYAKMSIVPDPRTNAILVNGGSPEQRRDLMTMVAQLDVRRFIRREDTEVIYLKYLPAETFAPVVQSLLDNYLAEREGTKRDSAASRTNTATQAGAPSLSGNFNLQNPLSNQTAGATGSSIGGGTSETVFKSGSSGARVQWEQSTNSIIITAPQDLIQRVKFVVEQLDIRRPQVLIEAIIAECTLDKDLELGIEWREFNNQFNTRFQPTGPLTSLDSSTGNYNTGGVLGAVGSGLTLGIFKDMNLRFLLRALKGDNNSNILATPNIMTLDNEPALIKIGRKVSFAIGEIENNPTGGNPFTSFEREDVGLTLSIKPQITPNGSIRLYIEQVLSSVLAGTERAGGNPDTSQRYIQTTVMAEDRQVLVIGGLLQNEWQKLDDKVPLLGDIPYVGSLFKNTYRKRSKSNLMLFLRPVILYDEKESARLSNRKYRDLDMPPAEPVGTDHHHHPHKHNDYASKHDHHEHPHSHWQPTILLPEPWI